jgi:hypothetical protein
MLELLRALLLNPVEAEIVSSGGANVMVWQVQYSQPAC